MSIMTRAIFSACAPGRAAVRARPGDIEEETMQRTAISSHVPDQRGKRRSSAARKSNGKRVTKSGDSGKGSTRKSHVDNPDRPPKPAIKRSRGTKRSPPGDRA